jgi:hypothetical protein
MYDCDSRKRYHRPLPGQNFRDASSAVRKYITTGIRPTKDPGPSNPFQKMGMTNYFLNISASFSKLGGNERDEANYPGLERIHQFRLRLGHTNPICRTT